MIGALNVGGARFPEGFKTKEVLDWNSKVAQLQASESELNALGKKVVQAVANSTDPVSKVLGSIFEKAIAPTSKQFAAAVRRKEIGNPPGKTDDPVGDQLTWVQFMDSIGPKDTVYIVSYDGDYFEKYSENEIFLNPFLFSELIKKGVGFDRIRFFNRLSTALEEIKKSKPTIYLPNKDEIQEIRKEESEIADKFAYEHLSDLIKVYKSSAGTSASDLSIYDEYSELLKKFRT